MNAERPDEAIEEVDSVDSAEEEVSELEQAQLKADENWDRYLRTAAELENVRKRASRDVENAHRFALERFGRELLAVRDSLEMGLAVGDKASVESLLEGSEATLKVPTRRLKRFRRLTRSRKLRATRRIQSIAPKKKCQSLNRHN